MKRLLNWTKIVFCRFFSIEKSKEINKLKAFSIIETLTAMVLLIITFGIAISTFDMVQNTDNVSITVNANLTLKQIIAETQRDKTFYDETINRNGFIIEKIVEPYNKLAQSQELIHLKVSATIPTKNQPIMTINKLIEQ